ncbi:MAG: VRR-NUC domain-containing protein [Alphaproteobacteria bacterium]|nr:MAG: VRR-NUC domain-containing protein [Alphaproteobacteria bacterium]
MRRPEQDMQRIVARWLTLALDPRCARFCHVPNGGARSPAEGKIFKSMGVRAGVPDLLIEWHVDATPINAAYIDHGWIEMKAGKGRLTAEQDAFLGQTVLWRGHAALCRSLDEVQATLRGWGVPLRIIGK